MNVKPHNPFIASLVAALFFLAAAAGGGAPAGDIQAQIKEAINMAEAGDTDIMFRLGKLYANGEKGLKPDLEEAVKWFRRAAEAGSLDGIQAMTEVYRQGIGVKQDFAEAHKWSKKAAELGSANDQRNVGYDYMNGRIVPEDLAEAEKWFVLAAGQGDADAALQIGNMAMGRYQEDKDDEQSMDKAFEWYGKAAELGEATAQFNMGVFYNNGIGREKDFAEAGRWYERAARNGKAAAQYRMGMYYIEGKGRSPDPAQAGKWLALAAGNGYESATAELAKLPPNVQSAVDRPLRIDLADLVQAFVDNPDKADAKLAYRMLDVVQDMSVDTVSLNAGVLAIAVKEQPLSALFRMVRRDGRFVVTTGKGTVYRGFCVGAGGGSVKMEGVSCIASGDYDQAEADPAPEMKGAGGMEPPDDGWPKSLVAKARGAGDILDGDWAGEYSDVDGGDSYRLVITKEWVILPDEGVQAGIVNTTISSNMASLGAVWTDGGDKRVALFSGVIDGDGWEGIVMVTENGKAVFQGRFRLERK